MDEQLSSYLIKTLPSRKDWVMQLEERAKKDKVPIMDPISIHFLMQLIRIKKPDKILEIGTAIGYSALRMVEAYPKTSIVTIERDKNRYHQAVQNIKNQNRQNNIHVIYGDALEKISDLADEDQVFDLIFIDATKEFYKHFFELSSELLTNNGLIISDNVLFKGYIANPNNMNKRYKRMVKNIQEYNDWLIEHPNFVTSIVPIGDGVAISFKK